MSWNHRVLKYAHKHVDGEIEITYQVHEVYYDKDGKIEGWTAGPTKPTGETLDELKEELGMFMSACEKPVLEEVSDTETGKQILKEVI